MTRRGNEGVRDVSADRRDTGESGAAADRVRPNFTSGKRSGEVGKWSGRGEEVALCVKEKKAM